MGRSFAKRHWLPFTTTLLTPSGHHSCNSARKAFSLQYYVAIALHTTCRHRQYSALRSNTPGYSGSNTILTLSACDGTNRGGRAHCATILSACAIIANNCSGGWLSSSRTGQQRTCPDADGLIPPGTYFFHVDVEPDSPPYPVVPNFRAWSFPHDEVPYYGARQHKVQLLQDLVWQLRLAALPTCALLVRHLTSSQWQRRVGLRTTRWISMASLADALVRMSQTHPQIYYVCDLHSLWDNLFFSMVPKATHADEGDSVTWYTHSVVEDEELCEYYHNMRVQPLSGRAAEYLFARFAWDIFPKVIGFLQGTLPRRLAVRQANGEVEVKIFTPQECKRFTEGQGRGRSASPTKRTRVEESSVHKFASGDVKCLSAAMGRKRSCSGSSGHSQGVDSVISDVSQTNHPTRSSRPKSAVHGSHWNLTGQYPTISTVLPVEQTESNDYCVDGVNGEENRGRKRRRSWR